jgi:hypothetical protein
MQTTPTRPSASSMPIQTGPRVVETCRGTAHPEHERVRELVVQSLLLRGERITTPATER